MDAELELLESAEPKVLEETPKDIKPKGLAKSTRKILLLEHQLAEAKALQEAGDIDLKTPLTKPKRVLSEKQKETLKKGQDILNAQRAEKRAIKEKEDEINKIKMEELIIKKAIVAKKRQLKKKQELDSIIPDEEPEEKSSGPLQKTPPFAPIQVPIQPPKPRIIFY
jgi:hypothetical protein